MSAEFRIPLFYPDSPPGGSPLTKTQRLQLLDENVNENRFSRKNISDDEFNEFVNLAWGLYLGDSIDRTSFDVDYIPRVKEIYQGRLYKAQARILDDLKLVAAGDMEEEDDAEYFGYALDEDLAISRLPKTEVINTITTVINLALERAAKRLEALKRPQKPLAVIIAGSLANPEFNITGGTDVDFTVVLDHRGEGENGDDEFLINDDPMHDAYTTPAILTKRFIEEALEQMTNPRAFEGDYQGSAILGELPPEESDCLVICSDPKIKTEIEEKLREKQI